MAYLDNRVMHKGKNTEDLDREVSSSIREVDTTAYLDVLKG